MNVLDVGGVDAERKQEALRIGDYVALASLETLGCIKPAWTAAFRGFYTLTIDYPCRGNQVAASRLSGARHKQMVDPPPYPLIAPEIKIVLNCGAGRELFWQPTPLAAIAQNIHDRIDDRAQIDFARPPKVAG